MMRDSDTARDQARLAIAIRRDFPNDFTFFNKTSTTYGSTKLKNPNNAVIKFLEADGIVYPRGLCICCICAKQRCAIDRCSVHRRQSNPSKPRIFHAENSKSEPFKSGSPAPGNAIHKFRFGKYAKGKRLRSAKMHYYSR